MKEHAERTVALALSGGAARTIAHVGVLKSLQNHGVGLRCIAGTSGGALIAVMVAAGYPLVDLEREAMQIEWRRLAGFRPHPLGILSTEKLGEFVRRRIGELRFEDLRIPCRVVATDLSTQSRRVFDSGPVVPAVEASCAIPEFYRPVTLDGHDYIDGGVVEPLPLETLRSVPEAEGGPVVGVSVLRKAKNPPKVRHAWQLLGQISQIIQYEMVRRVAHLADLLVEPEIAPFPFFDLDNASGLIACGEEAMEKRMPELERLLSSGQGVQESSGSHGE